MPRNKSNQSGSILIYILLGIVLLGMLFFVFSRNSGNSSGMAGKGSAKVQAAEIIEFGRLMQSATSKILSKGCSENEISFENAVVTGYINTTPAPADKHCHVFESAGVNIPPSITKWVFLQNIQITSVGTTNADLVAFYQNTGKDVCTALNSILNIALVSGNLPSDSGANYIKFVGTYNAGPYNIGDQPEAVTILGKSAGCFYNTLRSQYDYYQVLISR